MVNSFRRDLSKETAGVKDGHHEVVHHNASLQYADDILPITVTSLSVSGFNLLSSEAQVRSGKVKMPRAIREKPLSIKVHLSGENNRNRFARFIRRSHRQIRMGNDYIGMTFRYPSRNIEYKVALKTLPVETKVGQITWEHNLQFVMLSDMLDTGDKSPVAHEISKMDWWNDSNFGADERFAGEVGIFRWMQEIADNTWGTDQTAQHLADAVLEDTTWYDSAKDNANENLDTLLEILDNARQDGTVGDAEG